LQAIGAVAPTLATAPSDPLVFPWVKAFDFRLSWAHTFHDRFKIEPSVGFFNLFNFSNFNLPPGHDQRMAERDVSAVLERRQFD
jgi:hypothetical protein